MEIIAPQYPALVSGKRRKVKLKLLEIFRLPGERAVLGSNGDPGENDFPLTYAAAARLVFWMQIWLANDEDLSLLRHYLVQDGERPLSENMPQLDNPDCESIKSSAERFPCINPASQRSAALELKLMFQKEKYQPWSSLIVKFLEELIYGSISPIHSNNSLEIEDSNQTNPAARITSPECDNLHLEEVKFNDVVGIGKSPFFDCSGIICKEPVAADTELCFLPIKDSINLYTAFANDKFCDLGKKLLRSLYGKNSTQGIHVLDGCDCDFILLIYLIWCRHTGVVHRKYFTECVPDPLKDSTTANLMLAPPEVLDFLNVAAVTDFVRNLTTDLFGRFQTFQEDCLTTMPGNFPHTVFTWENVLWARCVLDTRGFAPEIPAPPLSLECISITQSVDRTGTISFDDMIFSVPLKQTSLLPGIDMFNHHPLGQCRPPRYDAARGGFSVKTEVPLRPGEIFLSYGPCETWQLLLYYGFCPPAAGNLHFPTLDTIAIDIVREDACLGVEQASLYLRDPLDCSPAVDSRLFEAVPDPIQFLTSLMAPSVEALSQLQQWATNDETRPYWFDDWRERLTNYFELRRNLVMRVLLNEI